MDFLLNEKSLHGQFGNTEEFLKSLGENLVCFQLVQEKMAGQILKISDFYKCRITENVTVSELKKHPASDELRRFRIALEKITETTPFWDEEPEHDYGGSCWCNGQDVSATAIAEAAVRENGLLSFLSGIYADRILEVTAGKREYEIYSIYTPRYLVESYKKDIRFTYDEYVKMRYRGSRLDCTLLERKYGADTLEKDEFISLLNTLDKFTMHESWESIALDDGLEYKKYSPAQKKDDWFRNSPYCNQQIMKFRISSRMRCFGYRKKDYFRLLRIERDHSISDKG